MKGPEEEVEGMGECVRGMDRKVEAIKVQEIEREIVGSE